MKKRLLIFGNFLICLAIIFVSTLSYDRLKAKFLGQTQANLKTAKDYFFTHLDPDRPVDSQKNLISETVNIFSSPNLVDFRISIIEPSGQVLADSSFAGPDLNNHRARQEVYAVIQGQAEASAVRYSTSEDKEVLYYATAFPGGDLILRMSSGLDFLQELRSTLTQYGIGGCFLGMAMYSLALHFTLKKREVRLAQFTQSLALLVSGDLTARLPEDRYDYKEIYHFAQNFNVAMTHFAEKYQAMAESQAWLESMVNSLNESLVVVNRDLHVVFINKYAQELFNRHIDPQERPYPFVLLTHETAIDDLCNRAFKEQGPLREEYLLQVGNANSAFQALVSKINDDHLIVLFHDMSLEYETRQLRSSFVANVTHELKTPLTSIRGFVETLRYHQGETSPDQLAKFLAIIDLEADRLERLINDLLHLSDIERLDEDYDISHFDLVELMEECLVQLDGQAMAHQVHLLPGDSPVFLQVQANRDRVKQIFLNLIDNAIKYNREGGKVVVTVDRKPDHYVYIEVEDNGYGFDQGSAKRIFERFYRVDKSRSKKLGGTGLGLSIVKHIALLYDGEAMVSSQPGQGTKFTIKLKI